LLKSMCSEKKKKWMTEVKLVRSILHNISTGCDRSDPSSYERIVTSRKLLQMNNSKLIDELLKMDNPEDFLKLILE